MKKPTILVTTSTYPRWESDTDPPFVHHLCKGLLEAYEVHVLAPHCRGCPTEEELEGVIVHRYRYAPERFERLAYDGGMLRRIKRQPLYFLLLPSFLTCQWLAVKRLQRNFRYDFVHGHWIIPQGLVLAFSGLPYLITSHGGDLYALRGRIFSILKRRVLRKSIGVTVVSRAMVEECVKLGVPRAKVDVQSMGVDVSHTFVPKDFGQDRRGILVVGRLVEKKGVATMISALALLRKRGLALHLTVIGDGPERRKLEARVRESGLGSQVEFLGALHNSRLPFYYQKASIFVLPSIVSRDGDQEGLGLVSVEAMGCGCAVIASDLPAVRDVITDGVEGILVEPGSSDALAKAIEQLSMDDALRVKLADMGRQKAAQFDWPKVCQRYREILSNRSNMIG